MRVEITRQDVDHCKQHGGCPMTRACSRALKRRVLVNTFNVSWVRRGNGYRTRVRFPPEATAWVRRWDNHREGDPLSFDLDVPGERREAS